MEIWLFKAACFFDDDPASFSSAAGGADCFQHDAIRSPHKTPHTGAGRRWRGQRATVKRFIARSNCDAVYL